MSRFDTAGHGPLIHTSGWFTTSPEELRREAELGRTPRPAGVVVRKRGDEVKRLPSR